MNNKSYVYIGFVSKKIGFKGKISIKIDFGISNDYLNLDFIHIDIDKKLTPFKILSLNSKKNIFLEAKLDQINCEKGTMGLMKRNVYVRREKIISNNHDKLNLIEYLNFEVTNPNHENIGFVNDVFKNKFQNLIELKNKKGKTLIPFVKNYIVKIDKKNKILILDLPEGIFDL